MRRLGATLAVALAFAPAASAQGPRVDHSGVGCMLADRFPRIEARLEPADAVSRARVYFRATGTEAWYFVEMKASGSVFHGTLPKPKRDTKGVEYYVEALDKEFRDSRTAEHRPRIVGSAAECGAGMPMAATMASAQVVLGAASGAPAVPAGFANAGVVAASGSATGAASATSAAGGLSTGAILGVVGGGAAVAAGVAVAASGGSSNDGDSTGGSGSATKIFTVTFGTTPAQGLDVSACVGRPLGWCCQNIGVRPDGTFSEVWSPGDPNTLRVTGRADATRLDATLTCVSGAGPTGSISATGNGTNYNGTFVFGASQGPVTVTRQ